MDSIHFLAEHSDVFLILVAIVSLLVGSFLNVVIYRLPQMMKQEWGQECREYLGLKSQSSDNESFNLYLPLSHCTHCKNRLKPWHNIPVISFLILRGKCAFCHAQISLQYPLVEILCSIASVYVAWRFGMTWQTAGGLLFTWIAISLTFIDLEHHLLPDQLTLFLVWAGLFLSIFSVFINSHDAIIGAMTGYCIFAIVQWVFHLVTGKVGMGQGDFKFLAGLGAFLGWQQVPVIILLSSIIGLIFGITQLAIKHQLKSVPLPFGPYLAIAGWISLIWGPEMLHFYFHHFF